MRAKDNRIYEDKTISHPGSCKITWTEDNFLPTRYAITAPIPRPKIDIDVTRKTKWYRSIGENTLVKVTWKLNKEIEVRNMPIIIGINCMFW